VKNPGILPGGRDLEREKRIEEREKISCAGERNPGILPGGEPGGEGYGKRIEEREKISCAGERNPGILPGIGVWSFFKTEGLRNIIKRNHNENLSQPTSKSHGCLKSKWPCNLMSCISYVGHLNSKTAMLFMEKRIEKREKMCCTRGRGTQASCLAEGERNPGILPGEGVIQSGQEPGSLFRRGYRNSFSSLFIHAFPHAFLHLSPSAPLSTRPPLKALIKS